MTMGWCPPCSMVRRRVAPEARRLPSPRPCSPVPAPRDAGGAVANSRPARRRARVGIVRVGVASSASAYRAPRPRARRPVWCLPHAYMDAADLQKVTKNDRTRGQGGTAPLRARMARILLRGSAITKRGRLPMVTASPVLDTAARSEPSASREDVVGALFDDCRPAAFNLAYRLLRRREDAADAVQDAYVLAVRAMRRETA